MRVPCVIFCHTMNAQFELYFITVLMMIFSVGGVAFYFWQRDRRYTRIVEEESRRHRDDVETERLKLERERFDAEQQQRYETRRAEEDRMASERAGTGSGGYIVMEMPARDREQFHDLLKGFEDYAKLKGYQLAFSIDTTFEGRVAFKFTVGGGGIVVGAERVRADFKEYVEQVRHGAVDDLDNLPVIVNLEEHNLLVTLLKNRITFLQHNLRLSKTAIEYYESILSVSRTFPALPAPTVVVQTGGNMDSRSYNASHSQRLIQGDGNASTDSSVNINIGQSFNQKQERIAALAARA
jgi:hypothetical protein